MKTVVDAVPALLVPGGFVIWTRGGSDPDHRPEVRRWFQDAGFDEMAYDVVPLAGTAVRRSSCGRERWPCQLRAARIRDIRAVGEWTRAVDPYGPLE